MPIESRSGGIQPPEQSKNNFVKFVENTAVIKYTAFTGGGVGFLIAISENTNNHVVGAQIAFAYTVVCTIIGSAASFINRREKDS